MEVAVPLNCVSPFQWTYWTWRRILLGLEDVVDIHEVALEVHAIALEVHGVYKENMANRYRRNLLGMENL